MSFLLDPLQDRIASFTESSATSTNHYSDAGDSPSWISASGTAWTRTLTGLDGKLAASVDQSGSAIMQLANPHGDIVASMSDDTAAAGPTSYAESTEYGVPRAAATAYDRYGWTGAKRRSLVDLGGLVLMGARLYNPTTGRFLSVDPVYGGNENAYVYPDDPINGDDATGLEKIKQLTAEEDRVLGKVAAGLPLTAREKKIFTSAKNKLRFNEKIRGERNKQKRASERDKGTMKLLVDTLILAGLSSQIGRIMGYFVKFVLDRMFAVSVVGVFLGALWSFADAELLEQI